MLSIIIPFYNEAESIPILTEKINDVCMRHKIEYELVLVDDGSTDNSELRIQNSELIKKNIKNVKHKKRLGKGEALNTGVKNAKGDIIAFMDADLQDDPEDLPKMLKKIEEGFDFVNGIRMGRHQDNPLLKIYSFFAEKFLKIFANSPYSDINCGIKVFRKSVLKDFVFYGNNFRFFPLAVFYNGYKVGEIEVNNKQRKFGTSKFGPDKLVNGIFDTITALFIYKFAEKPLHFFGMIGGLIFSAGFLISLYLSFERIFFGVLLYRRPALWLGIALIIVGIQIVMTGIIGELIVFFNKKTKS